MRKREVITIFLNGVPREVLEGTVVSAALLEAQVPCRVSVSGEARTAMCGMGICFECRATINSASHQRTCQMLCRDGMRVETSQ
jgi:D-hydroxyproline dehydrogenase subunit gamma